ncbi:hypothetical protein PTTG_08538 [Puccinia triticina 1-1 BBBD Race 1]|uniref:Uncharacterized protein n=1 Tax=Puccinia triticina (isolate 1-1 / race 1 (BBBD)) TaxID=630390 RepID=A0A180H5J9_PUCT1|nr:hypothetical protein PTTG_08538 [Puccinia triticina 1-1 BBBD Race 1]
MKDVYNIKTSEQTVTQRKATWGLLFKANQETPQLDKIILKYYQQGLTNSEIYNALKKRHRYSPGQQTFERKIQTMGLQRRQDVTDDNDGTGMELVLECVKKIHQTPEGQNVGYCKLKHLLQMKFGLNIHLTTAASINRALDPEGVERQSKRALKRRVFEVPGPNFIWSANGHNKLKKFGITLYGFIDAWNICS